MSGSQTNATGTWRPLVEYSLATGISLSTLRRYIKAGKVEFRVDHGRYLLFDGGAAKPAAAAPAPAARTAPTSARPAMRTPTDYQRLELELQRAREEIAELKTLIAFYEETQPARSLDL